MMQGDRGTGKVLTTVDAASLHWRSSLALRTHSPTGLAWGYRGSGTAYYLLDAALVEHLDADEFRTVMRGRVGPRRAVAPAAREAHPRLAPSKSRNNTRSTERAGVSRRRGSARGKPPSRAPNRPVIAVVGR